jgi:hypothetical protein
LYVVFEHDSTYFAERSLDGSNLEQHIDAVAIVGDHPHDARNLTRDALEPSIGVGARSIVHLVSALALGVPGETTAVTE